MKLNIPGTESDGPIMLLVPTVFAAVCTMLSLCSHFLSCMEGTDGMRTSAGLPVNINDTDNSGSGFELLNH